MLRDAGGSGEGTSCWGGEDRSVCWWKEEGMDGYEEDDAVWSVGRRFCGSERQRAYFTTKL